MEQKLGPLHGLRPGPLGQKYLPNPESLEPPGNTNSKKKISSQIRRQTRCKKTFEEHNGQNIQKTSILPDSLNARLEQKS